MLLLGPGRAVARAQELERVEDSLGEILELKNTIRASVVHLGHSLRLAQRRGHARGLVEEEAGDNVAGAPGILLLARVVVGEPVVAGGDHGAVRRILVRDRVHKLRMRMWSCERLLASTASGRREYCFTAT